MSRILYRGGHIYSPVSNATAMLVDGAQIAWVGSDAAAASLDIGRGSGNAEGDAEGDEVVELDGAWVAPAFVDAHVHVTAAGLAMSVLDLAAATDLADVLELVSRAAASIPAGGLIWGTGWDETRWGSGGPRRAPAPAELDRAASGHPVYLARTDVHSAAASSALLHAAGLPVAEAAVTGQAHHALRAAARRLLTPRQLQHAADAFFATAVRQGIGMVHDCSGPDIGDDLEWEVVARAAGSAGVELVGYWGEPGSRGVEGALARGGQPAGDVFVDGSIGSRTAALREPYLGSDEAGTLLLEPTQIAEHLAAATRAGLQAGFHAIGDAAISAVVDGLNQAAAIVGAGPLAAARHRLEHLEMSGPEHWPTLARFGVIASVQPAFDTRWGAPDGMYAERLGPARAATMNDFAGLAAAGIALAFGSDAPVTPPDPWATLRAATQTSTRSHALSARAAFAAHTRGGHRAARRDGGGVLSPGAEATFAIWTEHAPLSVGIPDDRVAAWSTDPRSGAAGIPELSAAPPRCAATVVAGRVVFDAGLLENPGQKFQPAAEV